MARRSPARERPSPAGVAAATVAAVVLIVAAGACASGRAEEAARATRPADVIETVRCPEVEYVDVTAQPVSTSGLQALARLARVESAPDVAPSHSGMSGHDHGGNVSRVDGAVGRLLKSQLRRAAERSCHLRTATAAEAAGYYLGSPYVEGVGTHWINWSLVDRPFDPARPSMLLFKTRGIVTELAGFSYWVRSETAPVGFAGSADHWHQHSGLCFSAGQWAGEELARADCEGVWLNGGDLWMLHAWVVPDHDNDAGVFATRSRELCRPNMPDIVACPR